MSDSTTRLLTLLNVSATKASGKRKRPTDETPPPSKLNKRRELHFAEETEPTSTLPDNAVVEVSADKRVDDDVEGKSELIRFLSLAIFLDFPHKDAVSAYEDHFGSSPKALSDASREAVTLSRWSTSRRTRGKLGQVLESLPEGSGDLETKNDHVSLASFDRLCL
jgi:U3 small nucleolar RNA-associated protein 25